MNRSIVFQASLWCCLAVCVGEFREAKGVDTEAPVESLPQALQEGVVIMFKNRNSERCIGVDHASKDSGALLKQFKCVPGAPNQRWEYSAAQTFVNEKSKKCIGVDRASVKSGANIGQYNCSKGAPNQSWVVESNDPQGGWNLRNVKSKKCIGVENRSKANGAQLKQVTCNYNTKDKKARHQHWFIDSR